jgi:hypothetical protein
MAHILCNKRFERYLPQYERVAAEIEKSAPYDFNQITPTGWTHLSLAPLNTYREDDGSLTIEFLVGIIGPPQRHTVYIYRSNGVIEKGSKTSKEWHWPTRVNEHWFKAGG